MDAETRRKLAEIGDKVSRKHAKGIMKEERMYDDHQLKMLKEALTRPEIGEKAKAQIREQLESEIAYSTREVIDEEKEAKLQAAMDREIHKQIKAGRLKPAKKDAWHRRIEQQASSDSPSQDPMSQE